VTGCRGGGQESGCALRRDRQRVTVLSEQRRLEEHCKDAEQRGLASRGRRPRLVRPERCRKAQMHVSPIPPAISSGQRYTVPLFPALRSPFPIAGYIELEELAADEHRFSDSNLWLVPVDRDPNGPQTIFSGHISSSRDPKTSRAV